MLKGILWYMPLSKLYDIDNLHKSYLAVKKQSGWKKATQKFEENYLLNLIHLRDRLVNKAYVPSKPIRFILNERGKTRLIESYTVEDRIVQGCFVNDVLMPLVRPHLIYDNSASMKNRGTSHFRNRLERKLQEHARKYGNKGYILLGDYSKYFDNLVHQNFYDFLKKCNASDDVIEFTRLLLKGHILYVNEDKMVNSIEYHQGKNFGSLRLEKSMGIGSQIAQTGGICGAYRIDNLVKNVFGEHYYGRYMDDFYIISTSKDKLKQELEIIEKESKECGLFLNKKKTQIVSLKHNFVILKTIYRIKNHTVIKKPKKETYVRERHKLKKLANKDISVEMFIQRHKGWSGDLEKRFGKTKSLNRTEELYKELLNDKRRV